MLIRRKKQVTLQRAMAFMKRLSTLSMHVLPNASVGLLAASRASMHVSVCVHTQAHHSGHSTLPGLLITLFVCQAFPKCDLLLDNNVQGSGFYLPELDEPEHCNAQNTSLWELHTLQVCTHTHTYTWIRPTQAFI